MRYEWKIAFRHLMSLRGTFLSTLALTAVLAVTLGVGAFTVVVSIASGFVDAFQERVLGVNPHVLVLRNGMYFRDYRGLQEDVEALPGIEDSAPFVLQEMLVSAAGARSRPRAMVKGIELESALERATFDQALRAGSLESLVYEGEWDEVSPTDANAPVVGLAIGRVLAERAGVEMGDELTLLSPLRGLRTLADEDDVAASWARFRVEAVIESGFYDFDNQIVLVDFRALQALAGRGDAVTGVEVYVDDVAASRERVDAIGDLLPPTRFNVLDWRDVNRNLFASLQLQKIAMTLVVFIVVAVSCSVILSVLIMLVLEKRRDIAIMRSLGMSRSQVMRVFIAEGLLIGFAGVVLGVSIGTALSLAAMQIEVPLAYEVYRIDHVPLRLRPLEVLLGGGAALVLSFLATLYPAYGAAKVAPAEALRYD